MTLIAAFKNRGIPFLLGDFLLTNRRKVASGLRKKVHVIAPNVAIGWTGHAFTAASVLKDLYTLTKRERLTREKLLSFLKQYPRRKLSDEVHLVGWIIDKTPRSFLWNSVAPSQVHWDHAIVDGIGKDTFENVLASAGGWGATNPSSSKIEAAIRYALFVTAQLMADEVLGKQNRKLGFGYCYETLYYDGLEFRPVANAIYSVFEINPVAHLATRKPRLYTFFRYFTLDGNSIIEQSKLDSIERRFDLVTPIFEQARRDHYSFENSGVGGRLDFTSSDYYLCGLARYTPPSDRVSVLPFLVPPNTPNPIAFIRTIGQRTDFGVNVGYFIDTYKKKVRHGDPSKVDFMLKHVGPGGFIDLAKVLKSPSPGTVILRWRMGKKSDDIVLVDLFAGVFKNRISVIAKRNKAIQLRVFDGSGRKSQITSKPHQPSSVLQIAAVWDAQSISLWVQDNLIGTRALFRPFEAKWKALLFGIDIEGDIGARKVNVGYNIDGITGMNLETHRKLKGARLTDVALFGKTLTQEDIQEIAFASAKDVISKKAQLS